ncbi:probable pectinesterase 53 [Durio zibethinus]|uniref:pectinesterase n=1 Tax=Durio zibethinus TaxID=66656 RepID=A0A6P5ZV78_DURZI|nr:probable pectinesterase 53 [Durio zibethinus]
MPNIIILFLQTRLISEGYMFLMQNTTIQSVAKNVVVNTAQAGENVGDDSGFTFLYCNITGASNSTTDLGRAWKLRPRVIFAFTYISTIINSEGWSTDEHPERNRYPSELTYCSEIAKTNGFNDLQTVHYGEYKCMGPGVSSSGRVGFAKILSEVEAKPFMSMTYIHAGIGFYHLPECRNFTKEKKERCNVFCKWR